MRQKKALVVMFSMLVLTMVFSPTKVNAKENVTEEVYSYSQAGICKITTFNMKEELKRAQLEVESKETEVVKAPEEELVIQKTVEVPYYEEYTGRKALEAYQKIQSYVPGALENMAVTDVEGFRRIDNRYLVAVGTYFSTTMGQYFDLVLENGTVIPCIVGDQKSDFDTDEKFHAFSKGSKECSEFIVNTGAVPYEVLYHGDASRRESSWVSPVKTMIFYEKVVEME